MKLFYEKTSYLKWINRSPSHKKTTVLNRIVTSNFPEFINKAIEKDRRVYLKNKNCKIRSKKYYANNKSECKSRAKAWVQKNRQSSFHKDFNALMEYSKPNIMAGTIQISNYLNKKTGYLACSIKGKTYGVAQLVLMKKLGGFIPRGLEVNHIDLNKQNNKADNLEPISHLENIRHAHKNNARRLTRLSLQQIGELKKDHNNRCTTVKEIARKYKISIVALYKYLKL